MTDGVIGSVAVAVVPDANSFWVRFREQTAAGAGEAGRRAGEDWQRGFNEATRSASIRVRADTSEARAQVAALNRDINNGGSRSPFAKLISAAITLAPAIVPLGAAAAAAGAEFVALGATGVLALKGIQAEIAAGTPVGAEYSGLIRTLKGDLAELGQTASSGVLDGFQRSVGKLQHDIPQLNTIVESQSAILGDVASHLTGGLVGGFTTFAPLLDQVGGSVDRIASHFEAWATGAGGARFATTLSSDYATVAPLIDQIATGIGHIAAASNGVGIGILSDLGLLAQVISSFPTPALELLIAGFVSFRTVSAITGVVTGVSAAFAGLGASTEAAALQTTAANLAVEASAAQAAAAVAASQAAEAAAVAESQAAIAASLAGTGSVLAAAAAESATFAAEEAAAFQVAAAAAVTSAEEIGVAAAAAAEESAAAAAVAGSSWSAMLGPIGIAVGAVALIGLTFLNSSKNTDAAAHSVDDYTAALVRTHGAINDTIRADVATKLGKLLDPADLKKAGLTLKDAVDIVTQVPAALAKYKATDIHKLTNDLITDIYQQSHAFKDAAAAAKEEEAALAGVGSSTDYTKRQISDGNTALRGYIDSLDTFNKSADTAADRGKLIGQVLVAANGDALAYAGSIQAAYGAQNALGDAFVSDRQKISDLRAQIAQLTQTTGPASASSGVLAAQINKTGASIDANKTRIAQLESSIATGTLSSKQLASAQGQLANAQASGAVSAATLATQHAKLNTAQGGGTVNTVQLAKLQRELAAALKDTELGAIKFTGAGKHMAATIDYTAKGAGPLIGQLQSIQTASEKAAAAVYQHELRTKGGKQAADDAYNFYVAHTAGALAAEAKQLGLTADQAKALGDEYFGIKNSGDIKKRIELIGQDQVTAALKGILQDLDILIGKTTVLDVQINAANAKAPKNIGGPGGALHIASGGYINGTGPKGIDSVHALVAPGEFMMSDKAVDRFGLGFMEAINAGVMPSAMRADTAPPSSGALAVTNRRSVTQNNTYYWPTPERASSSVTAQRAAASKLGRL